MSTRIFYSGVENAEHWDVARQQTSATLVSYWYIRDRKLLTFLEQRHQQCPDMHFMVDSGAHTIMANPVEMRSIDWEKYLADYCAWIRAHRGLVYAAVELDIGETVGMPVVYTWRKKYFEPLEKEGVQIIYVWHAQLGLPEWESMCRRYRYVGLTSNTFRDKTAQRRMMLARKYRTRVHGFAITSYKAIRDYAFCTADSTSWKAGEIYGVWVAWTGNRLATVVKESRRKWKDHIEAQGYDFELMCSENGSQANRNAVTSYCLHEYRRMEDAMNLRQAGRGNYWDTRLPYPEVLTRLTDEQIQAWAAYFGLEGGVRDLRAILASVSMLHNSMQEEYLADRETNDENISTLLKGDLVHTLPDTFDRLRDIVNSRYMVRTVIQRRSPEEEVPLPLRRAEVPVEEDDDTA